MRLRHASFIDGVDLFDNKLFGLSLAETKGGDLRPQEAVDMHRKKASIDAGSRLTR